MTLPAQPNVPGGPPEHLPARPVGPRCSTCSAPLTRMGPQPFRTGGVAGHPEAVMWLDTFWCPSCGKVVFFSIQ